MKAIENYKQELEQRLAQAGLENSDLSLDLRGCCTAGELLSLLKQRMTQWVLDFQVTGSELEEVFSQTRLKELGIFTGDQKVTVEEAYSFYAFDRASVIQKGDYCVGHFYEHATGEVLDGKARFYHQTSGTAYNGSMLFAHQDANVVAHDQSQLTLMDRAKGTLYAQSSGIASGQSTLTCHDNSFGFLTGHSSGHFLHSSMGQCEGNSRFIARHAADVEAYGHSSGCAQEKATISLAEKAELSVSPDFEGIIQQSNRTPIAKLSQQELSELMDTNLQRPKHLGR